MSNALKTLFQDTADAIRAKTGDTGTMKPAQFPAKIAAIEMGVKATVLTDVPIELDLKDGNQTITAADGTLVKSAIILKPDTLIPENIAEGVTIAGVEGTYAGGGSGEVSFDLMDESLKYFAYNIDHDNKIISLFKILYDVKYAITGSYDITIPDTIGGYNVVLVSE